MNWADAPGVLMLLCTPEEADLLEAARCQLLASNCLTRTTSGETSASEVESLCYLAGLAEEVGNVLRILLWTVLRLCAQQLSSNNTHGGVSDVPALWQTRSGI